MDRDTIRQLIESHLPGCEAVVEGDDGAHFTARVVATRTFGQLASSDGEADPG